MKEQVSIRIDDNTGIAKLRTFKKSGNKGYGYYGRIMIDDEQCMVSCNIVILSSRQPKGAGINTEETENTDEADPESSETEPNEPEEELKQPEETEEAEDEKQEPEEE